MLLPAFGYAAHLDGENLPAAFIAHAHGRNKWCWSTFKRQPEVTIFSCEGCRRCSQFRNRHPSLLCWKNCCCACGRHVTANIYLADSQLRLEAEPFSFSQYFTVFDNQCISWKHQIGGRSAMTGRSVHITGNAACRLLLYQLLTVYVLGNRSLLADRLKNFSSLYGQVWNWAVWASRGLRTLLCRRCNCWYGNNSWYRNSFPVRQVGCIRQVTK